MSHYLSFSSTQHKVQDYYTYHFGGITTYMNNNPKGSDFMDQAEMVGVKFIGFGGFDGCRINYRVS